MKVLSTMISEIPESLLRQKPQLHAGPALDMVSMSPGCFAFEIRGDDESLVAAFWMHMSETYNQLFIDTLIIDEEKRSMQMLKSVCAIVHDVSMALGRSLGADAVTTAVHSPKFIKRMFPGSTVSATVLKMELS